MFLFIFFGVGGSDSYQLGYVFLKVKNPEGFFKVG